MRREERRHSHSHSPSAVSYQQLFRVNPDELLLRMGEYDLNDEFPEPYSFQDRKVQIVASHPKFDPKTFEYDLALLRLERSPVAQTV